MKKSLLLIYCMITIYVSATHTQPASSIMQVDDGLGSKAVAEIAFTPNKKFIAIRSMRKNPSAIKRVATIADSMCALSIKN